MSKYGFRDNKLVTAHLTADDLKVTSRDYSYLVTKLDSGGYRVIDCEGSVVFTENDPNHAENAIQWAINQSGSGCSIFIKRGAYNISDTISIKNGLSHLEIRGEGQGTHLHAKMNKSLIEIGEVGTYTHNIKIADLGLGGEDVTPIGIKIFRSRLPVLKNLHISHFNDSGIKIGGYTYYGQISGCHIYSNSNYGIYASYALYETGSLGPFSIRDVSLYNHITDIHLHNIVAELATVSFESATNGITMNNVKSVSLTSCYFEGLTYGIKVEASAVSRVAVIEPYFAGDVGTILVKSGGGTAHIEWVGDWNKVSRSDTATIPSGNSSVVVDHGLVEAPSDLQLTGTHSEVANCWVSDITDTQFTINAPANVTADRDVYWEAEV